VIKLRRTGTTLDLSQSGKEELKRKEEEKRKEEKGLRYIDVCESSVVGSHTKNRQSHRGRIYNEESQSSFQKRTPFLTSKSAVKQ